MEGSLQPVEIGSNRVGMLVRNQPRQALSNALPHDARFAMIHAAPLFQHNGRDVR